jgi:hypothetical protein
MYGVKASFKSKTRESSFHPNISGQRSLAKAVEATREGSHDTYLYTVSTVATHAFGWPSVTRSRP